MKEDGSPGESLMAGGDTLLLDEPSNDLDVETLGAIEVALPDFAGTVPVISNDRWSPTASRPISRIRRGFSGDVLFRKLPIIRGRQKHRLGATMAPKRIRDKPVHREQRSGRQKPYSLSREFPGIRLLSKKDEGGR